MNDILEDLTLSKLAKGEMLGPLTGYPSKDKPWLKYYDEDQIKTEMPQTSCYRYLFECNSKYLGRTALSYFGRKITFEELFLNIDSVASALKEAGVSYGDIITISLPNIPEAAYLFYACSKIGAIANMVDPRTSDEGIREYVEEVNSKLVIIIDSYYYKVKKLVDEGIVDKIVAVSPAESLPIGLNLGYRLKGFFDSMKDSKLKIKFDDKTVKWADFMSNGKNYNGVVEAEYIQNSPLVIEHTGGTTGKPKGVVLSNENINSVALQSVLTGIDMQREHNWLDIMPTFIAYGVGMGLHLPLTIGMETILIPQFDPKKFDDLLVKYKPIHMVGVPSYWQTIIDSKKLANADLSYIIAPTVGGDAMKIALEKDANEFLANHNCTSKITKGYGMTEVTGGVAGTIDENNEIGSVGIPFVKTVIAIFDPVTGEECRYNETGEICVTGPNTMLGYFDNEEATDDILRMHSDGKVWVHSGDIGYMTEHGNIFVVDRMKRMIVRYDGFKVFPSMIENVISSHEAVESCAVVGIDDINHGQGRLPKAHIVLREDYTGDYNTVLDEIEALCIKNIQEYALPCEYHVRDELPLTSVGKVDFLALESEEKTIGNAKILSK